MRIDNIPPVSPLPLLLDTWRTRRSWLICAVVALIAALFAHPYDDSLPQLLRIGYDGDDNLSIYNPLLLIKIYGNGEVAAATVLLLAALGRKRRAWQLAVGLIGMSLVVHGLKHGIARTRPSGGWGSFPSGDSATAAVLISILAAEAWRCRSIRWLIVIIAPLFVLLVGYARMAEFRHHPSDVAVGLAIGLATTACVLGLEAPRWWRRISARWFGGVATVAVIGGGIALSLDKNDATGRELLTFITIAGAPLAALLIRRWARAWYWTRNGVIARGPLIAAIIVWMVIVYGCVATGTTLWDRDEPRNALASVEMHHHDAWLVPTFNGEFRLHKPPLVNWAMRACFFVVGPSDFAARLPAIIASIIAVLCLGHCAMSVLGSRAPPLAMAMLASTPLLVVVGTAATTDALLLMGMSIAAAAFCSSIRPACASGQQLDRVPPQWRWTLGIAAGLTLALLAKGPVALASPLGGIIFTVALVPSLRRAWPLWLLHTTIALGIGCAIILAWFIPANAATNGAYYSEGIGEHVVGRSVAAKESHGGNLLLWLPFYPLVLFLVMLPWTTLLPTILKDWWQGRRQRDVAWCWATGWGGILLIILSVVATKLPHYALPVVPALALLGARWWTTSGTTTPGLLRAGRWIAYLPLGLLCLAPIAVIIPWYRFSDRIAPLHELVLGCTALAIASASLLWALPRRPQRLGIDLISLFIMAGGFLTALGAFVLPAGEALKPQPQVATIIRAQTPAEEPVTLVKLRGFEEGSLFFYLDRSPVTRILSDIQPAIQTWIQTEGPGILVVDAAQWATAGGDQATSYEIGRVEYIGPKLERRYALVVRRNAAIDTNSNDP